MRLRVSFVGPWAIHSCFAFLLTYFIMAPKACWNGAPRFVEAKLLSVSLLVFIVWDAPFGLFDSAFAWLGNAPVLGAPFGTRYEWYFRSGLEHWSAILGMVTAHCLPSSSEQLSLFGKACLALAALLLFAVWWSVASRLKTKEVTTRCMLSQP